MFLSFPATAGWKYSVERDGTEQVASHALFDLDEGVGGRVNPVYTYVLSQASEFGFDVQIADELGRTGHDKEQVFDEAAQGAEQVDGLLLAVSAGAVALGGVEERGVIGLTQSCAEQDEGVLAAGEINAEVEGKSAAYGSFGEARGDNAASEKFTGEAEKLAANIDEGAWDGGWYLRAYFDSGEKMGSAQSVECVIDSLPQSWAVISGLTDPARAKAAMENVDARLVDRKNALIKIF